MRAPLIEPLIPGSKSITNRAALLSAMARGASVLEQPLVSDDTVAFVEGIQQLGARVSRSHEDDYWMISGFAGPPNAHGIRIWCADAGTAARFLPALCATGNCRVLFEASDQLSRRPMSPLLNALRNLGVRTEPSSATSLPFILESNGLDGGDLLIDGSRSSQFLSALLMVAPLSQQGLTMTLSGEPVSAPYLEMTIRLMERYGVYVNRVSNTSFCVEPQQYESCRLSIEPDASSASYLFAAAALMKRTVRVTGLGIKSLQGDLEFVNVLARMGADVHIGDNETTVSGTGKLDGVQIDMGRISDTFMTLACIAPFANGPVRIYGIGHVRLKESDRIAAVAKNLRGLGVQVVSGKDWIEIAPTQPGPGSVRCYRDHRIAMSFAVLALRSPGVTLDDPDCVRKTFPLFHEQLASFRSLESLG